MKAHALLPLALALAACGKGSPPPAPTPSDQAEASAVADARAMIDERADETAKEEVEPGPRESTVPTGAAN